MFGHDSLPSLIYTYDAMPPLTHGDEVRGQMLAANEYRNRLVAIERDRRDRTSAVLRRHYPRLVELESLIEPLAAEIKELRADAKRANVEARRRTGTNKAEIREKTEALAALKAERKALKEQAFGSKKAGTGDPEFIADLERVDADAQLEAKEAYNSCPSAWGTRLQVMKAAQSFRKGAPPKFHRFQGQGKQAVQLQGGMTAAELFGGQDTRLRVDVEKVRHAGKRLAIASIRIGSAGREPVFATVRFHLHRPLPEGVSIKWAWLMAYRIGTRMRWKIQFTLSRAGGFAKPDVAATGEVGVNLGWRVLPDNQGLRVAAWSGSDGEEGELIIPPDRLTGWSKQEDLQAIRQRLLNGAVATLAAWIRSGEVPPFLRDRIAYLDRKIARRIPEDRREAIQARRAIAAATAEQAAWRSLADAWLDNTLVGDLPEALRQRLAGRESKAIPTTAQGAAYIANWCKAARLASFVLFWKKNRFPGDELIFAALEAWRCQDAHLFNWQAHLRDRAGAWRDDFYRKFAARLRRKYRLVKFGAVNYRELQANPEPEEEAEGAVGYFRIAACGRLREVMKQTSGESVAVPAKDGTRKHHECGHVCEVNGKESHLHRCEGCGVEFDIDYNNARNTLAAKAVAAGPAE